jgi:hypothetical protein
MIAPGVLETELVEDKASPQLVGTRVRIEFRIENGTLFTTTHRAARAGSTSKSVIKVESTWIRE